MTFNPEHLDIYRGERAVFDFAPVGIPGGFESGDTLRFQGKRLLSTADGSAEIGVDGAFVEAQIFRVTIPDAATLAASFNTDEICELYYSAVWTRGTQEVVLRAGTLWVHPHARSS